MKIRILGNSIRLRLTQSEVQTFLEIGKVKERIKFGPPSFKQLTYSVQKADIPLIHAAFSLNEISILIPSLVADQWAKSDQVSLAKQMLIGEEEYLKVLVEKDFKCLTHRGGEDETDMYPHPNKDSSH